MAKHGEYREQYLNAAKPRTLLVVNDDFGGDIMSINEEQFNPKTMKRCNEHGQLLDERGRVLMESIPKAQVAPQPQVAPDPKQNKEQK